MYRISFWTDTFTYQPVYFENRDEAIEHALKHINGHNWLREKMGKGNHPGVQAALSPLHAVIRMNNDYRYYRHQSEWSIIWRSSDHFNYPNP